MIIKNTKFLLLIIIPIFIYSCKKDELSSWNSNWVVPIANTNIGIENLLPDSLFYHNAEGNTHLSYIGELNALNTSDLIKIPDTSIINKLSIPFGSFAVNPGTSIYTESKAIRFGSNSQITYAIIHKGKLKYKIKNYTTGIIDFKYRINEAKKNGIPLEINKSVSKRINNQPGIIEGDLNLSGYELYLRGPGGQFVNTLFSLTQATSSLSNPIINITPTDSIVLEFSFEQLSPWYARGNFAPLDFELNGTSDFNLYNVFNGGNISIADAKIALTIENGIGADISAKINQLLAQKGSTQTQLQHQVIGTNLNFTRAIETPYTPTKKEFILNAGNSNIVDFINIMPDKLYYSLSGKLNPLGNISGFNDFIYADKLIKAYLNIDIPMTLSATDILLADTSSFKSPISETQFDRIKKLMLTIHAENLIPSTCKLKLDFLDENKVSLFSIIPDKQIESSQNVNNVNTQKYSAVDFELPATEYDNFLTAKYLVWSVLVNTQNQPEKITWHQSYKMKINLTGKATYEMQLK